MTSNEEIMKFEILKKYFHPTSYRLINKKDKKSTDEYKIEEKTKNLECFDTITVFKQFHMKVYGIKLFIHNQQINKSLIIYGILDDVIAVSYTHLTLPTKRIV